MSITGTQEEGSCISICTSSSLHHIYFYFISFLLVLGMERRKNLCLKKLFNNKSIYRNYRWHFLSQNKWRQNTKSLLLVSFPFTVNIYPPVTQSLSPTSMLQVWFHNKLNDRVPTTKLDLSKKMFIVCTNEYIIQFLT